jgi:hypothetical protein
MQKEDLESKIARCKSEGICFKCQKPSPTLRCAECQEKVWARNQDYIRRCKKENLCVRCKNGPIERTVCESCKERGREYVRINRIRLAEQKRKRKLTNREKVFEHYGEICNCCGEAGKDFLQIDHVNGNGSDHRKTWTGDLATWVVKNNFPEDFQILCANCNFAKKKGVVCPHLWEDNSILYSKGLTRSDLRRVFDLKENIRRIRKSKKYLQMTPEEQQNLRKTFRIPEEVDLAPQTI